jgi:thiol-disulfide isomerase/thioredoxin
MKAIARFISIAVLLLAGVPAFADEPVTMDAARISHLAGLKQIDGRRVDPDRLRGRPVIVSVFASWSRPCNAVFEHLKLLHLAHAADGLEVIAINLFENATGFEDDGQRLERFLGRHTPVFPIVAGSAETAQLFGNVQRIPAVFVFDRQGGSRLHFVRREGDGKPTPDLSDIRRAVRDALGFGAAGHLESLPRQGLSVTNPTSSRYLVESTH